MSEGWVIAAYVLVYGFMAFYGLYLMLKGRQLRKRAIR